MIEGAKDLLYCCMQIIDEEKEVKAPFVILQFLRKDGSYIVCSCQFK